MTAANGNALVRRPNGDRERKHLLVVGAGPKAIAILAKAHVLATLGFGVPAITVVERRCVAANWCGEHGYTDGRQLLGTSPEKDLGFPYRSRSFGADDARVDERMHAFSWHRFLTTTNRYAHWVDRGRPAPEHREWARYLRWAARGFADCMRTGEVRSLGVSEGRWTVAIARTGGALDEVRADGVVLTGPGESDLFSAKQAEHPRVLDGRTVWLALPKLRDERPRRVAVIGAGESAGSAALALTTALSEEAVVEIVVPTGTSFSRGESYTENRFYSDPNGWRALREAHRRELIRRTDRAVISPGVKSRLEQTESVAFVPGRVVGLAPSSSRVDVTIAYGDARETLVYDYVVIATGFDPATQLRMLTDATRDRLFERFGTLSTEGLAAHVTEDLSLAGMVPRLHLPMMAGLSEGPGFPNLSCLGLLSDRILAPYVSTPTDTRMGGHR